MATAAQTQNRAINLYPKQGRFVGTSAHHAAFVGGIGSGKSVGGAVRATLASQGYIGNQRVLQTPNLGVVTAPTYPMLNDATVRVFLDLAGGAVKHYYKSPDMRAVMVNGSEVLFRSTEHPDRLRGPSLSWWWDDEAAMSAAVVRSIMIGRLRQFGKRGYEWRTTTPRGRNHIWQTFVRDNPNNPDYFLIQATSADNVFLDRSIIEDWTREYVGDFAEQELGGEFVAFSGLIYSEFDRLLHVTGKRPDTWVFAEAGVDWGFANPGVIEVGLFDSDNRAHIIREEYQRQRQIDDWVNVAKQLRDTYGIRRFHCDPSEPTYIRKFRDAGLNAVEANNSVLPGIQAVKARLTKQGDGRTRLTFDNGCVHTIDEFEMYQWGENRYGMQDAPVKAHDHAMDALRYLIMGVDKRERKYRETTYGSTI